MCTTAETSSLIQTTRCAASKPHCRTVSYVISILPGTVNCCCIKWGQTPQPTYLRPRQSASSHSRPLHAGMPTLAEPSTIAHLTGSLSQQAVTKGSRVLLVSLIDRLITTILSIMEPRVLRCNSTAQFVRAALRASSLSFPSLITRRRFYPRRPSGKAVWSQVSTLLPPGTCLYFLSRIGFSIPTAGRFSSNEAHSRSRSFR